METLKYNCDTCDFHTNALTAWEKHIETGKHKNNGLKRKTRRDKKTDIQCKHCEYKHQNIGNLKRHTLNNHSTKEEREKEFKYYCMECDYGTFSKDQYETHNNKKHTI